jgi:hypothetical protein
MVISNLLGLAIVTVSTSGFVGLSMLRGVRGANFPGQGWGMGNLFVLARNAALQASVAFHDVDTIHNSRLWIQVLRWRMGVWTIWFRLWH